MSALRPRVMYLAHTLAVGGAEEMLLNLVRYLPQEFELSKKLVKRAIDAGVKTLVFTVDASQPGRRLRDRRSGFGRPLFDYPKGMLSYALHPGWSLSTLMAGTPTMANLTSGAGDFEGANAALQFMGSIMNAKLDWESLDQIRALWPHKLIVKGVLTPADAKRIAAAGADAVMVSNHGGRAGDFGMSTIAEK